MGVLSIRIDDIVIGERHRALSDDAVKHLSASMRAIGLRHPVSIRISDNVMLDDGPCDGVPVLVAGAHRLAAARLLGWEKIDCIEVEDDPVKAEMWEIAENLHRCDLTKEQRNQHIRRYAELLEARATLVPQDAVAVLPDGRRKGPQHQKGIARQIAEATGLSDDTVRRALNPTAPRAIHAEPPKDIFDVHERNRNRLMSAWNGATEDDRAWFRDWIDTPIMDARHVF